MLIAFAAELRVRKARNVSKLDERTKGAWIVHHGRKIASSQQAASHYSAIDIAAKASTLLARLAENDQADLSKDQVVAVARAGGLNPITELPVCLSQLEDRRVINRSSDGAVSVLGVTGRQALQHAWGLFEANAPQPFEQAAIGLAELTSAAPMPVARTAEFISDTYRMTTTDTRDFLDQAHAIGFVDAEGSGEDKLLFNGNLFRNRGHVEKTRKILDALSETEKRSLSDFEGVLSRDGAVIVSRAETILGEPLLSKLKAAAIFDINIVQNESGSHAFVTSPGAFHKFSSPMVDDAFDQAKALVSALTFGITQSNPLRGRIWGVDLLLGKMLRGLEVGPADAIGNDYRSLELERVVRIRRDRGRFFMSLLKREVGEIALAVLEQQNAAATALAILPGAGMTSYVAPEAARAQFRAKVQTAPSRAQTRVLLSAVRSGGQL